MSRRQGSSNSVSSRQGSSNSVSSRQGSSNSVSSRQGSSNSKAKPKQPSDLCSPAGLDNFKEHGSCFTLDALRELATAWNRDHTNTPIDLKSDDIDYYKSQLETVLGTKNELTWIQRLGGMSQNRAAAKLLMPPKPKEWSNNPYKWLNNYNITHILSRFEGDAKHPYKLLGVVPIDFQGSDSSGNVLYPELHDFDLKHYIGKYKYLGLITNLDTHSGPGTHWTSSFVCIDPEKPCFGAYYYDSTFTPNTDVKRVPDEIRKFFKQMKRQAAALYPKKKFKNIFYRLNHQKGNTECGMFSIFYQVHWLRSIIENPNSTHKDIIRLRITDDQVWQLRNFFFA